MAESINQKMNATLTPYTSIVKGVKNKEIKAVGTDLATIDRTVSSIATNSVSYNILELNPSLLELVDLFQDRSKLEDYTEPTSKMYTTIDGLKMVKYEDSETIHTEGNAYAMYLLSTLTDRTLSEVDYKAVESSQKLFDELYLNGKKYFGSLNNTSLMPWVKGSKDTATDAEVYRLMSLVMAQKNINKGLWSAGKVDYKEEIQKLSKDILDNSVIYITTKDGTKLAVPVSGTNFSVPNKSNFVKETDSEYIFHYNISYSFAYVANLLSTVDERWALVKNTQKMINTIVLPQHGLRDWNAVKINKSSGEIISIRDASECFPEAQKNTLIDKSIEWPRFLLDHAFNYRDFKDKDSLEFLKIVGERYRYNLGSLPYGGIVSGSRNAITIAQSMIPTLLNNKLSYDSTVEYRNEVFQFTGYDRSLRLHTFNQLIVAMTMNVVESMVADEFKKDVIGSATEHKEMNESLIITFPRPDRIWNKNIVTRFDRDGILVVEGRQFADNDFEQVLFGSITIPEGYTKLDVEVLDIGSKRIWGDKAFSVFLNEEEFKRYDLNSLYKIAKFPAPEGREVDAENKMIKGGIKKGDVFRYGVKPGQNYQLGIITFCNHENNMILRFSLKK
jgi:hypothetical protein